jgi:hypothetical protein
VAILLPAIFIMLGADRLFLAVADRRQLIARQSQGREVFFGLFGARIAQRQVIFVRSALVGKSLHRQLEVRILLDNICQRLSIGLQSRFGVGTQRVLVVVEICVLNAVQQILNPGSRSGIRRTRRRTRRNLCLSRWSGRFRWRVRRSRR